jgi:8-amino-7-oxononanoate synthase
VARLIADELAAWASQGLRRSLRVLDGPQSTTVAIEGRDEVVHNFSSNDYLGFANDPLVREAMHRAIDRYGVGAGASRLVCGTLRPHRELEDALAAYKGTEAALTFSSGYAAAVGTLTSLAGAGDFLLMDKLCHASLIDGAKLSGATIRTFPHQNLDRLEHLIRWAKGQAKAASRIVVVTESVFSMDGDCADLTTYANLRDAHDVMLMVDEAHALGLFGKMGSGLIEAMGLTGRVDLQMGTLSKAVGLHGGTLCGRREVIDLLIQRARSFIYSTAPPPAIAATGAWVVRELLPGAIGTERRRMLWANVTALHTALAGRIAPPQSAIIPWIVGDARAAMTASEALLSQGFLVPAIRYPTVPRNRARLRFALTAGHTESAITALAQAVQKLDEPTV